MAIYTRKGDKGKTSLFNGQRVSKANLRIEVCGTVDELNSLIGISISDLTCPQRGKSQISNVRKELVKIQGDLFEIGSSLVSQGETLQGLRGRVKEFENLIDQMTVKMPKLSNFILPGGGKSGAMLHLARTICRRLERRIVELNAKQKIDNNIIIYLNRLSDLLFTMARFVNFKEKRKEIIWRKNG
jgi:cob(I)alamin adenosyltransferase